jgi:DNA ligase (NAD+)
MNIDDILSLDLDSLREWLRERNDEYRSGFPTISDDDYDKAYNHYSQATCTRLFDGRVSHARVENSIPMYGLEKIKTIEEFREWVSKNGLESQKFIITPKYDGVSCGVTTDENGQVSALVKGRENMSFSISHHFSLIEPLFKDDEEIVGELIIPQSTFSEKYSSEYKNVRNMVAGKLNPRSRSSSELRDFVFMKYTSYGDSYKTKQEMIDRLNTLNKIPVRYILVDFEDITEEFLSTTYQEFILEFEIDGLVIDVNDLSVAKSLGRNSIGNPKFSVAYKGSFGDTKKVTIKHLNWFIGKDGTFNPTISTDKVLIDGAMCGNNIYVDNASYVRDNGLRLGQEIFIKRSGKVIPRIHSIPKKERWKSYEEMVENNHLSRECPHCSTPIVLDDSLVDVYCPNEKCSGRNLQEFIFFFKVLGVEGMSDVTYEKIFNKGSLYTDEIVRIIRDRGEVFAEFGDKRSSNIVRSLEKCMSEVTISRLMHASNMFPSLGSVKLQWIVDDYELTWENLQDFHPTLEGILKISGFGDIQAGIFVENYKKFVDFYKSLTEILTFKTKVETAESDIYRGRVFCFTGFRNKAMEDMIKKNGGAVSSSYTKSVTDLVIKEKGSGSSKEQKAMSAGIRIYSESEFRELLGMETIIEEQQKSLIDPSKALF